MTYYDILNPLGIFSRGPQGRTAGSDRRVGPQGRTAEDTLSGAARRPPDGRPGAEPSLAAEQWQQCVGA